jgi:hypothetical protein
MISILLSSLAPWHIRLGAFFITSHNRVAPFGKEYPSIPSPSNVYLDLYLLGQDFRSGDVAAVFVCRS